MSTDLALQGRDHWEFVCRLKEVLPDREAFVDAIAARIAECGFDLEARILSSISLQYITIIHLLRQV